MSIRWKGSAGIRAADGRRSGRASGGPRRSAGSRPRTSLRRRRRSAGRTRGLLRHRRVGLRAGHRLAARLVVEEHEAAVDEGPEVGGPPDAHLALLHVIAGRQPDLGSVRAGGYGKQAKAAGEVDDLSVVGGGLLRHAPALSQRQLARNRRLLSDPRRVKGGPWHTSSTSGGGPASSCPSPRCAGARAIWEATPTRAGWRTGCSGRAARSGNIFP